MSSSKNSRQYVHLRSQSGPIEIRLLDKTLKNIATGYGELRRQVQPGIYLLQFSSGANKKEQFITVEPGQGYEDFKISIPIYSAAPLFGLVAQKEPQLHTLAATSKQPQKRLGKGGRLLLFIRNQSDRRELPIELSGLDLINGNDHKILCNLQEEAKHNIKVGCASLCVDVDPGGYLLRWHNKRHSRWSVVQDRNSIVDQPLWVQPGWITALFLNTNIQRNNKARMTGMSVHMRNLKLGFEDIGEEITARSNQAYQLALNSLVSGETLVPEDITQIILENPYSNPLLGILCAHSILQKNEPRWTVFDTVVRHLFKYIPAHPDIVALRLLGKYFRQDSSRTRSGTIAWPPMIYAGYRGLINREWDEGGLIKPSSIADYAAAQLLPQGPWTVWASIGKTKTIELVKSKKDLPKADRVQQIIDQLGKDVRNSIQLGLDENENRNLPESFKKNKDPAIDQVVDFLRHMRSGDKWPSAKNIANQIRQTGLPISTVLRSLKQIKKLNKNQ